jgi:hypothetical protein
MDKEHPECMPDCSFNGKWKGKPENKQNEVSCPKKTMVEYLFPIR